MGKLFADGIHLAHDDDALPWPRDREDKLIVHVAPAPEKNPSYSEEEAPDTPSSSPRDDPSLPPRSPPSQTSRSPSLVAVTIGLLVAAMGANAYNATIDWWVPFATHHASDEALPQPPAPSDSADQPRAGTGERVDGTAIAGTGTEAADLPIFRWLHKAEDGNGSSPPDEDDDDSARATTAPPISDEWVFVKHTPPPLLLGGRPKSPAPTPSLPLFKNADKWRVSPKAGAITEVDRGSMDPKVEGPTSSAGGAQLEERPSGGGSGRTLATLSGLALQAMTRALRRLVEIVKKILFGWAM